MKNSVDKLIGSKVAIDKRRQGKTADYSKVEQMYSEQIVKQVVYCRLASAVLLRKSHSNPNYQSSQPVYPTVHV